MISGIAVGATSRGKTYGHVTAIHDISLTVHKGEIFGMLGPNGAGKSTTLRILITILPPTSGTATILGHDTVKEAEHVRSLIGYVPQERAIDRFLTGREHLLLLGDLYHLPKAEAKQRINQLLQLVDLEEHADRPAKTYSGGMKRKLDIACGLLPNPEILFLDEPTLGLDVQSRLRIWAYVRQLKEQGITIVMTTNYLEEAEQLCDRLVIIDEGQIRALGSPNELKTALGGDSLSLTLKQVGEHDFQHMSNELESFACIRHIQTTANGLDIRVDSPEKALPTILDVANKVNCRIEGIEYHRPRLDDVFIAHTGHAIKGGVPDEVTE